MRFLDLYKQAQSDSLYITDKEFFHDISSLLPKYYDELKKQGSESTEDHYLKELNGVLGKHQHKKTQQVIEQLNSPPIESTIPDRIDLARFTEHINLVPIESFYNAEDFFYSSSENTFKKNNKKNYTFRKYAEKILVLDYHKDKKHILGKGGFGKVKIGIDKDGNLFAIKNIVLENEDQDLDLVKHEIKRLEDVKELIGYQIIQAKDNKKKVSIAMKYKPGMSLEEFRKTSLVYKVAPWNLVKIAWEIVKSVNYEIKNFGLINSDIKPLNMMLDLVTNKVSQVDRGYVQKIGAIKNKDAVMKGHAEIPIDNNYFIELFAPHIIKAYFDENNQSLHDVKNPLIIIAEKLKFISIPEDGNLNNIKYNHPQDWRFPKGSKVLEKRLSAFLRENIDLIRNQKYTVTDQSKAKVYFDKLYKQCKALNNSHGFSHHTLIYTPPESNLYNEQYNNGYTTEYSVVYMLGLTIADSYCLAKESQHEARLELIPKNFLEQLNDPLKAVAKEMYDYLKVMTADVEIDRPTLDEAEEFFKDLFDRSSPINKRKLRIAIISDAVLTTIAEKNSNHIKKLQECDLVYILSAKKTNWRVLVARDKLVTDYGINIENIINNNDNMNEFKFAKTLSQALDKVYNAYPNTFSYYTDVDHNEINVSMDSIDVINIVPSLFSNEKNKQVSVSPSEDKELIPHAQYDEVIADLYKKKESLQKKQEQCVNNPQYNQLHTKYSNAIKIVNDSMVKLSENYIADKLDISFLDSIMVVVNRNLIIPEANKLVISHANLFKLSTLMQNQGDAWKLSKDISDNDTNSIKTFT